MDTWTESFFSIGFPWASGLSQNVPLSTLDQMGAFVEDKGELALSDLLMEALEWLIKAKIVKKLKCRPYDQGVKYVSQLSSVADSRSQTATLRYLTL